MISKWKFTWSVSLTEGEMQQSLVKAFGMDVRHKMAHWKLGFCP